MTDPKDAKPRWPNGLQRILDQHGAKSLSELIKKKMKPKPKITAPRLPYKNDDSEPEPD